LRLWCCNALAYLPESTKWLVSLEALDIKYSAKLLQRRIPAFTICNRGEKNDVAYIDVNGRGHHGLRSDLRTLATLILAGCRRKKSEPRFPWLPPELVLLVIEQWI